MKRRAVLAIDQGTTGTRAILFDEKASFLSSAYQEFTQHYPHPGWVEHNPVEIWKSTLSVISQALKKARLHASSLCAIGITNQRETTILWDKATGKPVHRAIVWQDRRTASLTSSLRKDGFEPLFRKKTGLILDPYFSASKIHWLLQHVPGLKSKAEAGKIAFGTVDSWLLWRLTGGKSHKTDFTNASRTLLFNIRTHRWDPELLKVFRIPEALLPEAADSNAHFGETLSQGPLTKGIPITAIMGDQQAALYGQACYKEGQVKNTYGTGCFLVMNLGKKLLKPPFGLLTTLACDEEGKSCYALEGSIFIAGAAIQWLRDGLGFFHHARETEELARKVPDSGGVVVIPALTGLGSPYWNPHARGMITGLTRGTRREHIVRATLESLAHETADVMERMVKYSGRAVKELKVDGGATANRFLMQFQADILNKPVLVSERAESTAWGAAKLAARTVNLWPSLKAIDQKQKSRRFHPR
ncbi:MAG TPA: glycerol kinase GlpK, partial [bacterium]|nr:glycerol kinase GlpK [bacterium]